MPHHPKMSHRAVLHDHVEGGDVQEALETKGWQLTSHIEANPEKGTFFEVKWDTGDGGSIHYVIDDFLRAAYLVAVHEDPGKREGIITEACSSLSVWTPEELLDECDSSIYAAERVQSLKLLAAGAPLKPLNAFVMRIKEASRNRKARVREAAVWAMVYTEWPVFMDVLDRMAREDPDPGVAETAAAALEQFRAAEAGES